MRRSELNEIIREGEKFIASIGFRLPAFADRSPDDWRRSKPRAGEALRARLGWEIADSGCGEVSTVNDGETDNHVLGTVSRFPEVDEEEPPYGLIVADYAKL